jgi:hypothetical protein
LQNLGQICRRGIAERHDGRAGEAVAASEIGPAARTARHYAIEPVRAHQGGAVLDQKRLQGRQQLVPPERPHCVQRGGAVNRRVNGVILTEDPAENLGHDLADVGVGEIERDVAAPGHDSEGCRRAARRRRAIRRLCRRQGFRRANRATDTRGGSGSAAASGR